MQYHVLLDRVLTASDRIVMSLSDIDEKSN